MPPIFWVFVSQSRCGWVKYRVTGATIIWIWYYGGRDGVDHLSSYLGGVLIRFTSRDGTSQKRSNCCLSGRFNPGRSISIALLTFHEILCGLVLKRSAIIGTGWVSSSHRCVCAPSWHLSETDYMYSHWRQPLGLWLSKISGNLALRFVMIKMEQGPLTASSMSRLWRILWLPSGTSYLPIRYSLLYTTYSASHSCDTR